MTKPKTPGRAAKLPDMLGQRFGRLVVTSLDGPRVGGSATHPNGRKTVICQCDCGTEVAAHPHNLRAGRGQSCGCLKREREEKIKAAARAPRDEKRCSLCGKVKPVAEFHRSASQPGGWRSECRECRTVIDRERYDPTKAAVRTRRRRQAHPEKLAENNRRWQQANPDKVRVKRDRYAKGVRSQVFDHYGRVCGCCGSAENLTIDHINGDGAQHRMELFGRSIAGFRFYIWIVRSGFPGGLQTLCMPCNVSKWTGERCRIDHSGTVPGRGSYVTGPGG